MSNWLAKQFVAIDRTITINGYPTALFTHRVEEDASLTLRSDNGAFVPGNMYVVLAIAAR